MEKVYIIAEAGVNHNGSVELAKELIDVAAESGVDAIKFQTFKAENIVSSNAQKANYQKENTNNDESHFDMIKKLELNYDVHKELINYAKQKGVEFLSSPFDVESIELLDSLGLKTFKIPSGEITNLPYLKKIGTLKKNVILSTGMSTLDEIKTALYVIITNGTAKENIILLHANTEYPTPMQDVNLSAINTLTKTFNVPAGYSDHTIGIEVPIAAVALGATVIEKHITLSRSMKGPDHKASIEPNELKEMVKCIRNIEVAIGNGIKKPSASEEKNIIIARKSIHIKNNIKAGDHIRLDDLIMLRPGNGISPMVLDKIIGRIAKKDLHVGKMLEWEDME